MKDLIYEVFLLLAFEVLLAGRAVRLRRQKQETEISPRRNLDIQASTAIAALPESRRLLPESSPRHVVKFLYGVSPALKGICPIDPLRLTKMLRRRASRVQAFDVWLQSHRLGCHQPLRLSVASATPSMTVPALRRFSSKPAARHLHGQPSGTARGSRCGRGIAAR